VAGNFKQNLKHARAEGFKKPSNTSGTTFSLNFEGSNLANSPLSYATKSPSLFFACQESKTPCPAKARYWTETSPGTCLGTSDSLLLLESISCEEKKDRESQRQQCARAAPDAQVSGPLSSFFSNLVANRSASGATETVASAKRPRDEAAAIITILGQAPPELGLSYRNLAEIR
jgi:hypothetical protein